MDAHSQSRRSGLWLAFVLSFSFAGICGAQPGILHKASLEAMIAQSPLVFRGSISNYSKTVVSAPWTKFERGVTTGPQNGIFDYTLTFQVDEVLKGSARKSVELEIQMFGSDKEADQWADQHTELLCFAGAPSVIRDTITNAPLSLSQVIRLGQPVAAEQLVSGLVVNPPVPLMDLTEVSEPKEILARARWFAKQGFASTNVFPLPYGFYELEVPVTPELEKMAHRFVQSNDVIGIRALGYFKSTQNIRLIKPFLNDTNYYDTGILNCPWVNKRIYEKRKAAYEVLQKWGVKIPKTVCEERLPWHYDPSVREPLEVRIPTTVGVGHIGPNGDLVSTGSDFQTDQVTNVLVGSNMVTGVRFEWFVYPDGRPRPSAPTRVEQEYWPTDGLAYFDQKEDGLVRGQKYTVEMNYTLFETDNPPVDVNDPDATDTVSWRPQDGKNYRVFIRRELTTSFTL